MSRINSNVSYQLAKNSNLSCQLSNECTVSYQLAKIFRTLRVCSIMRDPKERKNHSPGQRACAIQTFRRNDQLVVRCGSVWYIAFYKTSTVGATE